MNKEVNKICKLIQLKLNVTKQTAYNIYNYIALNEQHVNLSNIKNILSYIYDNPTKFQPILDKQYCNNINITDDNFICTIDIYKPITDEVKNKIYNVINKLYLTIHEHDDKFIIYFTPEKSKYLHYIKKFINYILLENETIDKHVNFITNINKNPYNKSHIELLCFTYIALLFELYFIDRYVYAEQMKIIISYLFKLNTNLLPDFYNINCETQLYNTINQLIITNYELIAN